MNDCLQYQNELVSFLYEDELLDPQLKSHLSSCSSCQTELESLQKTQKFFSFNHDLFPSAQIEQKIFEQISLQNRPKWSFLRHFLLHPATVGISVFLITLVGTLSFKKNYFHSPSQEIIASNSINSESTPSASTANEAAPLDPNFTKVSYRMLDWNPVPRLTPDLDRPVLKLTSLNNLEQSSVEAVSTFQHQIAMRHMMDGDFQQASQALTQVIDRDQRYSQWEQAMMQHLHLMKRMGKKQEIQRDLARLKAYAYVSPELMEKAEEILR